MDIVFTHVSMHASGMESGATCGRSLVPSVEVAAKSSWLAAATLISAHRCEQITERGCADKLHAGGQRMHVIWGIMLSGGGVTIAVFEAG